MMKEGAQSVRGESPRVTLFETSDFGKKGKKVNTNTKNKKKKGRKMPKEGAIC